LGLEAAVLAIVLRAVHRGHAGGVDDGDAQRFDGVFPTLNVQRADIPRPVTH
jgi:hypothetical protein